MNGILRPRIKPTNNADNKLTGSFMKKIRLNSETYIKNIVTGWTDKKPFGGITLLFKHRMKTILVSTRWTNLKLVFHLNIFNFVFHAISPIKI